MMDIVVKILPLLAGGIAFFLLGRSRGKEIYKKKAEEEIRKSYEEAGKAKAEAEVARKESRIVEAASKSSAKLTRTIVTGNTKDSIMTEISKMIEESKNK